ncbi:hypothetical protein D3C80_1539490 [compost metagenome]
MVGVIQADAQEFPDLADTGAVADAFRRQGQGGQVERTQASQAVVRQGGAVQVGDDVAEVAYTAVSVDRAGLFLTQRAEAEKFHVVFP